MQIKTNKKCAVVILPSYKMDFTTKSITRDKEGHITMTKESIQPEKITLIIIYTPNVESPKYRERLLLDVKEDRGSNTVIVLVHLGPRGPPSCVANLHHPQTVFHPCPNVPVYILAIIISFKNFH